MRSIRRSQRRVDMTPGNDPVTAPISPMGRWRWHVGHVVGDVVVRLRPGLPRRLAAGQTPDGSLQALVLRSLLARHDLRTSDESLSALHRAWWSSRAGFEHHQARAGSMPPHFDEVLEPLCRALHAAGSEQLCEIGCGNAIALHRLAAAAPSLRRLIGLDLCLDQVLLNRAQPRDPRIHYRAADVLDWLPADGMAATAFACFGGVLAYFSRSEVAALLGRVASQPSAVFALAEPIASDDGVAGASESRLFGTRRLFSHAYPELVEQAGLRVEWSSERVIDGQRWLLLLARG